MNDPHHLTNRTWQLSRNVLIAQGLPESVALLRLLACWSSNPLPLSLLTDISIGEELPPNRAEAALRGLLDQSLTELTPQEAPHLRTHETLLESVSRDIPPELREALVTTAATQLLAVLPDVPQHGEPSSLTASLVSHGNALLRRVESWTEPGLAAMEVVAEAMLRLAVTLHREAKFDTALKIAEEAGALAGSRLGADHPATLRLRIRIGRSLYRLGRFDTCEGLLRETLADCERVFGPSAEDTLVCCLKLYGPLQNRGLVSEAAGLVRRAVSGLTASLGPRHPLTLLAREMLLTIPPGPELEKEAPKGPECIADCRRELGPDHRITLAAELDYAFALASTGRSAEALRAAQHALASLERRYGPDYPLTLAARERLSASLVDTGERAASIDQTRTLVNARRRVLGPAHPWTLRNEEALRRLLSE